jgi:hypothetical protein
MRASVLAAILAVTASSPVHAAGNVTVRIDAQRVTLDGDAAPNAIVVTAAADPDAILVVGLDGTTVNGLPETTAAGVRRLVVRTGDGPDGVELRQVAIRGDVHLQLGRGDDVVLAEQARVRRLDVRTGRGIDTVSVGPQTRVRVLLHVRTGPDRDTVLLESSVLARLVVASGRGDDVLSVFNATVKRRTRLFTNVGEDIVFFALTDFREDVDVNLGDDDDILSLDTVIFDDDSDLDGGDDDDLLDVDGPVAFDESPRLDDFEFGF